MFMAPKKGFVPWNKGMRGNVIVSEETRNKLRESMARRMQNPTWVHPMRGKKQSEEWKRKQSERCKLEGRVPPLHTGVKRSEETRRRMSAAQKAKGYMQKAKGAEAPNWRGGITSENHTARNSEEFSKWRIAVFIRDKHTCQG